MENFGCERQNEDDAKEWELLANFRNGNIQVGLKITVWIKGRW